MVSPLYLTLLIGPMEPLPAPKPLSDALVSVEVTESATGQSGFQLTFTLADKGILETFFLLAGGAPLPIIRVVLLATYPGIPQVLMDGVVLHTEVQPDAMNGSSKLVVTGKDRPGEVVEPLPTHGALILLSFRLGFVVPLFRDLGRVAVGAGRPLGPTHRSDGLKAPGIVNEVQDIEHPCTHHPRRRDTIRPIPAPRTGL